MIKKVKSLEEMSIISSFKKLSVDENIIREKLVDLNYEVVKVLEVI